PRVSRGAPNVGECEGPFRGPSRSWWGHVGAPHLLSRADQQAHAIEQRGIAEWLGQQLDTGLQGRVGVLCEEAAREDHRQSLPLVVGAQALDEPARVALTSRVS